MKELKKDGLEIHFIKYQSRTHHLINAEYNLPYLCRAEL
jgi:hypothetical protein